MTISTSVGLKLFEPSDSLQTIREWRDYFLCILMFKCIHGLAPHYLWNSVTMYVDILIESNQEKSTGDNAVMQSPIFFRLVSLVLDPCLVDRKRGTTDFECWTYSLGCTFARVVEDSQFFFSNSRSQSFDKKGRLNEVTVTPMSFSNANIQHTLYETFFVCNHAMVMDCLRDKQICVGNAFFCRVIQNVWLNYIGIICPKKHTGVFHWIAQLTVYT